MVTLLIFSLVVTLCLSKENATKTYEIDRPNLSCTYTLEVVASDENSLILELVNDCTNLRHVNVTLSSDYECKMLEVLSTAEVLKLFKYSLDSSKNEATMSLIENYSQSNDILLQIVIQLGFAEKEVSFLFKPKELNQNVLLNAILTLSAQIQELKSFSPVTFKEVWTGPNRVRSTGWQTINLNYVSQNSTNIRHNPKDGSIILHPGEYIIQGKINCHRVNRFVVIITDSKSKTLPYKGLTGNTAYAAHSHDANDISHIPPQTVIIEEVTNLYLRLWVATNGWSLSMYPSGIQIHASTVTVQQIS